MLNRHHKALELDKVLELLASYCSVADAKELARTLEPVSTLVEANALINQTSAAHALMAKQGAPSFGGIKNVRSSLSRAARVVFPAPGRPVTTMSSGFGIS